MILRVFPRKTKATPIDPFAFVGNPGFSHLLFPKETIIEEIHVSVTFTWDIEFAEKLAYQLEMVAPVKIGGPAVGTKGEQFEPGMYLKKGYTITSRGCPNKCWFCNVWRREGKKTAS